MHMSFSYMYMYVWLDCISNFRIFGLNSDIPRVSSRPNGNYNSSSKDRAGFFLDMYCSRLSFIPIIRSLLRQSASTSVASDREFDCHKVTGTHLGVLIRKKRMIFPEAEDCQPRWKEAFKEQELESKKY
jgi:hypothetical protein